MCTSIAWKRVYMCIYARHGSTKARNITWNDVLHRIFLSYVVDNNQQESIVGHSLPTVSERKFTDKCEWGIVRDTQVLALGRFFRTMSLRVLDVEVLCHYWTHISVYITASLRNHNHNLKSHFDGVRQFMGLPATAGAFNHSRWHEWH